MCSGPPDCWPVILLSIMNGQGGTAMLGIERPPGALPSIWIGLSYQINPGQPILRGLSTLMSIIMSSSSGNATTSPTENAVQPTRPTQRPSIGTKPDSLGQLELQYRALLAQMLAANQEKKQRSHHIPCREGQLKNHRPPRELGPKRNHNPAKTGCSMLGRRCRRRTRQVTVAGTAAGHQLGKGVAQTSGNITAGDVPTRTAGYSEQAKEGRKGKGKEGPRLGLDDQRLLNLW
ncbi:uncharacterized protein BCR38DRAFT_444206 [Pseudomassariella vexata]|uniref:Uncharacterized protein n=1 Tax=Pseudomassariella vexata TaxID=1141098 RepID=A0A1Y2DNF0_9PEZI|nr:uncharacterized protein BCR38DRAFT_444206 [Pseudomassariella vexata]ORY60185.1 hypothetical protein BCR38DRAFT_444206 [Pseudomassariella vexata]